MSCGHFSDDGRRLLLSKGSDSDHSEKIATECPKRSWRLPSETKAELTKQEEAESAHQTKNLPLGRFFVWWYAVARTGDHRRREDKNNLKMLFLPQAAKFS